MATTDPAAHPTFPLTVALDGDWQFTYTHSAGDGPCPTPPEADAFTCRMPVPAYWDDQLDGLRESAFWAHARFNPDYRGIEFPLGLDCPDASLPYLLGVGWYRREFVAPADARVTLAVGGVALEAWVWLNGEFIAHHLGHSTPFELPLDAALRPGEPNELLIAVANTRTDRTGCGIRGYKGHSGGITRPITLHLSGHTRIASCYVHASDDLAALQWDVALGGDATRSGMTLAWTLRDRHSAAVLGTGTVAAEGDRVEWTTDTCGLKPWSDRAPNLAVIELELREGRVCLDRRHQNFGLRRLGRDGTTLRLNGSPVFLRGVCEHAYYPLTCTPPTDVDFYRHAIRQFKSLGFNWLRFHTWVPPEEYLDAADELGMLIQVEAPVGFGEQEWLDILRSCRRHPSVVIYCCGNEELLDEANIARFRNAADACREHAPDALFNPHSALRGIEYCWNRADLGPDVVQEPYPHNPRRLEAIKQFSDCFSHYSWGHLSYGSAHGDPRLIDERLVPYERPCMSHELCIHGSYLDLDLEHRYEGTRIGTQLFAATRRLLARHGLLHNARRYFVNSCAWMRVLRKHALENARKCHRLAGYDLLGAIDTHWHRCGYPCGVMNEFYELKPGETADDVLQYNGDSILLLDHTNERNLHAGQPVAMELLVSLFAEQSLDATTVRWTLEDSAHHVHRRGELTVEAVPTGAVTPLGTIAFDAPALERPDKLRLCVAMEGGAVQLSNSWDFWVFPRVTAPAAEAGAGEPVHVVSRLDADTVRFLDAGGRVVLLGAEPLPTLATGFQLSCAGRSKGNLVTVVGDHWLTRRFPHEGFCDWQFYGMLEGGRAVVFDTLPLAFDPIIEVMSSFKLMRKQAALFETRVGRGRLLVCTLHLDPADPAAAYLRHTMLAYAASDAFAPRTAADAAALLALTGEEQLHEDITPTDEGHDTRAQL